MTSYLQLKLMANISIINGLENLISDIILQLLSYMAQDERLRTKERQREGIKVAREKGIKFGRRKIDYPKEWESIIELVGNKVINNVKAMEILGLKKTTYYKLLKEYKNNNF